MDPSSPTPDAGGSAAKKPTPKELRMLERAKAALAKADAEKEVASTSTVFGDLPLVQSAAITDRVWTRVCDLSVAQVGATVLVRARLFVLRETGKVLFLTLRQGTSTVQAVIFKNDDKDLFKWATSEFTVEKTRVAFYLGQLNINLTNTNTHT
jgi:hypothetical protein